MDAITRCNEFSLYWLRYWISLNEWTRLFMTGNKRLARVMKLSDHVAPLDVVLRSAKPERLSSILYNYAPLRGLHVYGGPGYRGNNVTFHSFVNVPGRVTAHLHTLVLNFEKERVVSLLCDPDDIPSLTHLEVSRIQASQAVLDRLAEQLVTLKSRSVFHTSTNCWPNLRHLAIDISGDAVNRCQFPELQSFSTNYEVLDWSILFHVRHLSIPCHYLADFFIGSAYMPHVAELTLYGISSIDLFTSACDGKCVPKSITALHLEDSNQFITDEVLCSAMRLFAPIESGLKTVTCTIHSPVWHRDTYVRSSNEKNVSAKESRERCDEDNDDDDDDAGDVHQKLTSNDIWWHRSNEICLRSTMTDPLLLHHIVLVHCANLSFTRIHIDLQRVVPHLDLSLLPSLYELSLRFVNGAQLKHFFSPYRSIPNREVIGKSALMYRMKLPPSLVILNIASAEEDSVCHLYEHDLSFLRTLPPKCRVVYFAYCFYHAAIPSARLNVASYSWVARCVTIQTGYFSDGQGYISAQINHQPTIPTGPVNYAPVDIASFLQLPPKE